MTTLLAATLLSCLLPGEVTDAVRKQVVDSIEARRERYVQLAREIWQHPELGYLEQQSSALLAAELEANGFKVERGVAGIPTAFVASSGSGRPVIAVLGEYDALPGMSQAALPEQEALAAGAPAGMASRRYTRLRVKRLAKTIAEKILSAKSKKDVHAGEIVEAGVDYVMVNDITGPAAFDEFEGLCAPLLRDKIVLIPDHYVPNKDVASAKQAKKMRDFARRHKIRNYYEVGCGGVCHQLMIEQGFVAPGRLIVGADSHTCSYGALGAFATGRGSTEAATVFARGVLWFKVPESIKFIYYGNLNRWVGGKDLILHTIGDIGVYGALYRATPADGPTPAELSFQLPTTGTFETRDSRYAHQPGPKLTLTVRLSPTSSTTL